VAFAWSAVARVVEFRLPAMLGGESQPLHRFRVESRNGDTISVDGLRYRAIKKLGTRLKQKAEQHSIPWTVEVVKHED
jgi:hypothetical protein